MASLSKESWPTLLSWDDPHVLIDDPNFDFEQMLAERATEQEKAQPEDDLFSLSPLSSLESSPTSTPTVSRPTTPFETVSRSTTPFETSSKFDSAELATPDHTPSNTTHRQKRKREKNTATRKKQRNLAKEAYFGNPPARTKATEKHDRTAKPILTSTHIPQTRVASTGYVGLNKVDLKPRIFSLAELVGAKSKWKFQLVKWDGRTLMPIVDRQGRIIGFLAGQPDEWEGVNTDATAAMELARRECRVADRKEDHRRGFFKTLRCGYSHGGGQVQPQNLSNNVRNAKVLENLNSSDALKRIAGFGSSILEHRAPLLHAYYVEKLGRLERRYPTLQRPFPGSIFPSTTYNLGPQTACFPHIDFANLTFGMCAITSLGDFNPVNGGHLVLWDCGLVIEFPPGSTILIPSSVVIHSNTSVSDSERRFSVTQYAAGGLFRWVDHGFVKVEDYRNSLSGTALEELDRINADRWKTGLGLLPHLPWASPQSPNARSK